MLAQENPLVVSNGNILMYKLRPYQQKGIDLCRQAFINKSKKILLSIGTGGGKSLICRSLFEMTLAKNPNAKLLYIVHRSVLVSQMQKTLKGLDVTISTLQAIGKAPTIKYDLVLSDEVHWGQGSKLANNINYKYFIGVTATPIAPDGYSLDGFDEIIDVAQLKDLIDLGFMPPLKVLSTGKINTDKIKTSGKDFNVKASFDIMSKSEIKKDIIETYKKYADGMKCICYCVNIEHSEQLAQEFIDAGYKAEAVHSKSDKTSIERFRNNELQILTNCDVLTTGLDMPDIYCLMLVAPTKSYIKSTQIFGRIRLNPKDPQKIGLIIDMAKVIENTQHPYQRFDFNKVKQKKKGKPCKQCESDMIIINKRIKPVDEVTYNQITTYRCNDCTYIEDVEEMKVINLNWCKCGEQLTDTQIEMKQTEKNIEFYIKCIHCGEIEVKREILLSEKELKEIAYSEVMQGGATWEKIAIMLREDCKKWGYNHRYSLRLIDIMKDKNKTPEEVELYIMNIRESGAKISSLQFKG